MQVFLSHNTADKDIVEAIGAFLTKRGMTVWIDSWRMTAGDSLIEKIGEGIEKSDRLVVCLSPNSVDSNWFCKEVATGLVMELAEDKGLGEKFVVPALLVPCKVPIMLRDKLYANFTNKASEAACEELLAGITDTPQGPKDAKLENRIVRTHNIPSRTVGKHALVIEFGVRISPTEGLHVGIHAGNPFTNVVEWFGPPEQPEPPINTGGVFTDSATRREPPQCIGTIKTPINGNPDILKVSTSYVERQNLTMRMNMRRFTRLTNAFSKKVVNLFYAVSLHFMYYNFCRIHQTLRVTPAMEAKVTDHVWSVEDIVDLLKQETGFPLFW